MKYGHFAVIPALVMGLGLPDAPSVAAPLADPFQAAPGPEPEPAKPAARPHAQRAPVAAPAHVPEKVVIQRVYVPVPAPRHEPAPPTELAPQAQPGPPPVSPAVFDGLWWTTMVCPNTPDGRTRGYSRQFISQVSNGVLQGESGTRSQPGWMFFQGRVNADGTMQLSGQGLSGNDPSSVAGQLHPGTPFQFVVNGRLAPTGGTGKRLGGRDCDLTYTKR